MRNTGLHAALRPFAERAAEHLASAVENGAEVPFEVAQETARGPAVLYRYRSLSDRFVRDRFAELERVEGYAAAVLALSRTDATAAYVRLVDGGGVPAAERQRAEAALRGFLARVWDDVTEFQWDEERFERAYVELESVLYEESTVAVVVAPLFGLRLAAGRLDLGFGLELARLEACEVPPEALAADEGESRPSAVVVYTAEVGPRDPPPLTAARLELRKLLTTLRLFKAGAVACGSAGWWRMGDGPWRSLALGASGRWRAGEYVLESAEQEQVSQLLALVRKGPPAGGPLPWAVARFEMGCEQSVAVEGLSDHLLALRALLDGDGSSSSGVALRLAALCAEPEHRRALQARVEHAFALERQLMRGHLDADLLALAGADSPDTIARELEDNVRAILRDVVCGYLIGDLKRVADDLLLSDGGEEHEDACPPSEHAQAETAASEDATADLADEDALPGEVEAPPEFVVRRRSGDDDGDSPGGARRRGKRRRRSVDVEDGGEDGPSDAEPPTEEARPVGASVPAEGAPDWGFDDDPSDYSAAV